MSKYISISEVLLPGKRERGGMLGFQGAVLYGVGRCWHLSRDLKEARE